MGISLGLGLGLTVGSGVVNNAPKFIIDTDFCGDCDDATAFMIAISAHKAGTINLIGVIVSSSVATAAPGVRAMLNTYGLNSIPIYAYQGSFVTFDYNDRFTTELRDRFGVPGQTRTAYTDDLTGYKTLLNASPDASVKIIGIGGLTSLSRLLNDSPALVAAKVISLTQMAGQYPSGGPSEYNMNRDIPASQNVYTNWPTPIIAHGAELGATVRSGPSKYSDALTSALKYSFDRFVVNGGTTLTGTAGVGREEQSSWDTCTVYQGIYGNGSNFGFGGSNGTISIAGDGVSTWSATTGTRSYVNKVATDAALGAMLEVIIDATEVVPAPATGFSIGLTEGSGQFSADPATSDMRLWLGGSERTQTLDPVWTDIGTNQWVWAFDGANDLASMQDRAGFNSSNLMLGILAKFTVVTTFRVLMCKEDGPVPNSHWNLRNNAGKLEFIGRVDAANTASVISSASSSDIGTATWMMLTASVLGTAVILRKNGVQIGAGTMSNVVYPIKAADRVMIGGRVNTSGALADSFQGQMAGWWFKAGAVAGDLAIMEADLRAKAASKGITIP